MKIIGERDDNSYYVESAENSPTIPDITLDLAGHIRKMEEMHEVAEVEIVELARPTVLFYRIEKLEILELNNANTNPSRKLPIQWQHAASQHPAFPDALTPG